MDEKQLEIVSKKEEMRSALAELEGKNGVVTPQSLVEFARPESSPIHNSFDWDDENAAEKYRLMQARLIINNVKVAFKGRVTNKYWNAKVYVAPDKAIRGYFPVEKVASDEEMHRQVLERALKEIEYWQAKYKEIEELRDVVDTERIEELKTENALS